MPKKIKFESFKYRFLMAIHEVRSQLLKKEQVKWDAFICTLDFFYDKGSIVISWKYPISGVLTFPLNEQRYYVRGDSEKRVAIQHEMRLIGAEDPIRRDNEAYFHRVVMCVAQEAGIYLASGGGVSMQDDRHEKERVFHDAWANSEDVYAIDVRTANEACTAPEMRYITQRLGDIRGKRLLDVGCGLGEASVYFALLGAEVTSSDLSQGMLDATSRLARANGVSVSPHLASAEDMQLANNERFDIIYAGNLLHHVDIEQTISRIKPHLAPGGVFVSWDPLAYNPAINVYRTIATEVRTPDEHPLTWSDIKLFHKHFCVVETRYFWFSTLLIFLIMALVQRRNPNKERFWKVVVHEGNKWRWLYSPLEKLDRFMLNLIPPLRLLCWNVVIICKV